MSKPSENIVKESTTPSVQSSVPAIVNPGRPTQQQRRRGRPQNRPRRPVTNNVQRTEVEELTAQRDALLLRREIRDLTAQLQDDQPRNHTQTEQESMAVATDARPVQNPPRTRRRRRNDAAPSRPLPIGILLERVNQDVSLLARVSLDSMDAAGRTDQTADTRREMSTCLEAAIRDIRTCITVLSVVQESSTTNHPVVVDGDTLRSVQALAARLNMDRTRGESVADSSISHSN